MHIVTQSMMFSLYSHTIQNDSVFEVNLIQPLGQKAESFYIFFTLLLLSFSFFFICKSNMVWLN